MRPVLAILLALTTVTAGCFGNGESVTDKENVETPIWEDYEIIDPIPAIDPWEFMTIDLASNESTMTSWAVFDKNYGGNCCEHYLATSIEGDILTSVANTPFGPKIEDTNGILTFPVY